MLKELNRLHWVNKFHPVLFWILFTVKTDGQNLLENPSFEDKNYDVTSFEASKGCPITIGYSETLDFWQGIHSVDLVHQDYPFTQRSGKQKVPPHSGKAMVGLGLIDAGDDFLPEFLFQKLSIPVSSGLRYRISFFLHLRAVDKFFPTTIGFNFTEKSPCNMQSRQFSEKAFEIEIQDSIRSENKWMYVSKEFTAPANGRYLVLGSFNKKARLVKKTGKNLNHGVYVFLDDMALINLDSTILDQKTPSIIPTIDSVSVPLSASQTSTVIREPVPELMKRSAIPSISFEYNSAELNTFYKKILSDIVPFLLEGNCKIMIAGHTDNIGDSATNQKLSLKRAQVIADFLNEQGIKREQMIIQGFGCQKPIAAGEDDFSRSINRRVEISKTCN